MPYIERDQRQLFDDHLEKLLDRLNALPREQLSGCLNYCISRLAWGVVGPRDGYDKRNTVAGVFFSAGHEFSRRMVDEYEDKKISLNGDLPPIAQPRGTARRVAKEFHELSPNFAEEKDGGDSNFFERPCDSDL